MTVVHGPTVDGPGPVALRGAREMLPYLAGVAPFGAAIGATAAAVDVSTLAGWSTSWLIFSGTPQMLALELVGRGASTVTVVVTVVMVNLRLAVYSSALAPHWGSVPRRRRLLASYLLTDPVYVIAQRHAATGPSTTDLQCHYLGAAATLWVGWLAACASGVVVGAGITRVVPPSVFLELVLVGMVVPLMRRRAGACHLGLAALLAVPALFLPLGLGPVVAATAATAAVRMTGGTR